MRAAFAVEENTVNNHPSKREKVELLAPAGNIEGFYGAIHAGADAVYLGGDKFGARAYADNFTTEELVECIRYAHIYGRKVYLTVNTLVKDKEWDQLYDYILPFYKAGLDGVIIQDMGIFVYLKKHFPGMELHVSTQMTLTGVHGAEYMKKLGACRIVPARELSLDEIRQIKEETGLEIEAFIHGAMCYCYSGQCLFSSILGGRSGNRGRCAQPCRLPYTVETGGQTSGECYPLSLKDMCTIEHIPELIEAGIDSFKIEGRMKKPEYAAGVTAIYRKVIDRYYAGVQKWQVKQKELQELSQLYIRSQRQDGYYHKHNGADMVTLHSPAYSGSDDALLARIRKEYIDTKPKMSVDIYGQFTIGEAAAVTLVCGNQSVTVTGDPVQPAQSKPVTRENIEKQLTKLGETVFCAGDVWIQADDAIFYPLKGLNELRRRAVEALENQLIEANGLCAHRADPPAPAMELPTVEASSDMITDKPAASTQNAEGQLSISITTLDQLKATSSYLHQKDSMQVRLYVEGDLLVGSNAQQAEALLKKLAANRGEQKPEIFLILPYIIRKRDKRYLQAIYEQLKDTSLYSGCMVRSLEGYAWLITQETSGKIAADSGFYIWNQETLDYWKDKLDSFTLAWELNSGEQRTLLQDDHAALSKKPLADQTIQQDDKIDCKIQTEKIVYGYAPMMLTANCVIRTTGGCLQNQGTTKASAKDMPADAVDLPVKATRATLTDRYRKQFPVTANCLHCMNIIYNSVPLSLHGSVGKWKDHVIPRLHFTIEDEQMTLAVLHYFTQLIRGAEGKLPYTEYTTGHEKRGVE